MNMVNYAISVPKSTVWSPAAAVALAHSLLEDEKLRDSGTSFTVRANYNCVEICVRGLPDVIPLDYLRSIVQTFYPLSKVDNLRSFPDYYPLYRRYMFLSRPSPIYYERAIVASELRPTDDPLNMFTQVMDELHSNESIELYITVVSTYHLDADAIYWHLTTTLSQQHERFYPGNIIDPLMKRLIRGNQTRFDRFPSAEYMRYQEKLQQKLYQFCLSIRFDTPNKERLHLLSNAVAALPRFSHSSSLLLDKGYVRDEILHDNQDWTTKHPLQFLAQQRIKRSRKREEAERLLWLDTHSIYLTPQELASLWHLPHKEFQSASIVWMKNNSARLPNIMVGKREGVLLGKNEFAGRTEPVMLTNPERTTHLHIVGKAGSGKSNLLHHLITQDIRQNKGVGVIDPHGQLVQDILRISIPTERMKDVVLIDLANEDFPPPLNLLALPEDIKKKDAHTNAAAGRLMTILDKQGSFADTVTVAPTLRAALITLWQEQTPTIRDIVRVFNNDQYRNKLLEISDNPVVEDFWDMFVSKSAGQREQMVSPIVTRMSDLYGNPYLYPAICHPDTLDFSALIAQRKIILISLAVDKGIVPPIDQRLIGSIVLFQIQNAVMNGAAADNPFYLYVDEAHHYITAPLDEMLAEVRKFNLSITLAHQFLKQLEGTTLEAVMGAVGTMIAFQCSPDDARALTAYMKSGFTADDLINLDLYHAAVYMRSGAQALPAFSLTTDKPLSKLLNGLSAEKIAQVHSREQKIRQLSIQQYTPKSRTQVLEWLRERYKRPAQSNQDEILIDPKS